MKGELPIDRRLFIEVSPHPPDIIPPPDCWESQWHTKLDLGLAVKTVSRVWTSHMPIPGFTFHFWNSNIMRDERLMAVLSLSILLLVVTAFLRKPAALVLYVSGAVGMLGLVYVKYFGSLRHHGHLFILLVVCLWLARDFKEIVLRFGDAPRALAKVASVLFTIVLLGHVAAGLGASVMDWLHPFSGARDAARFIRQNQPDTQVIVGDIDYAATAVAGYLGRSFYLPMEDRWSTFTLFTNKRRFVPADTVAQKTIELAEQRNEEALLVTDYEIETSGLPLAVIHRTPRCIVVDEHFRIYQTKVVAWERALAEAAGALRTYLSPAHKSILVPAWSSLPSSLNRTGLPLADFTSVSSETAQDSAASGKYFPAIAFWGVGMTGARLGAFSFMDDLENFIAGDLKFTLLGADAQQTVAVYDIRSRSGREVVR
jgi:hypothetical protein